MSDEIPGGTPGYEELMKMQKDPSNWTPLMKSYNGLVDDPQRLTDAVVMQMRQMLQKSIAPTWENFSKTRTWMVLSMNLVGDRRDKYAERWHQLHQALMTQKPEEAKP